MKRVLSLDVGDKRIGVAVSDKLNLTAQGLETISRITDKKAIDSIKRNIKNYDIKTLVVGMPLRTNSAGSIKRNYQFDKIKKFVKKLRSEIEIPIVFQDERYTTKESKRVLSEANLYNRGKTKHLKDKIAAQLILQIYLDKL